MTYPHISPGDKFRPSADKENAISRILESVSNPFSQLGNAFPEESGVALAYNCGKTTILPGKPVEIFQDNAEAPDLSIDVPAVLVRAASEKAPEIWGVALEEIAPGSIGPVQLHGVCVCIEVEGESPLLTIDVDKAGKFFYSYNGAARVIRYNQKEKLALVFLDQSSVYRGPMAARFDGESFSVINGLLPESSGAGYFFINGDSKEAETKHGITPKAGWLCLKGDLISTSGTFEITDNILPQNKQSSGKSYDHHPIAFVKQIAGKWAFIQYTRWEIPQLWIFEDCD